LKRALILVDLQHDFMPGGALPVANGNDVIPVANRIQPYFDLVVASQDWHPANHGSFASSHPGYQIGQVIDLAGLSQILWPAHCLQNTYGAELVKRLHTRHIAKIFYKGTDPHIDSYSAFFDNAHRRSTGLADYLHEHEIIDVYLMGVATDYCVKYSALDACHLGFNVYVIRDGCRGVNLQPDDSEKAFTEMQQAGAKLINSRDLIIVPT
jgi:nicotinamidase/pyrazinamidase